ncbi:MAG: phosphate acyltransferase, partial [Deltaproteobacteria bacterium]|nr:phosphate acyltransferase [Deltaproteobacteria bacterium]
ALEMCSSGDLSERPSFIVITSMKASDPYFYKLFAKIRDRIDNPLTPVLCLDSLEHEYLIANHLFEMYINPAKGESRLNYGFETRSMKQALQVLGSSGTLTETFSFSSLLDDVTGEIQRGALQPANLVLVGADNEDALLAVANAREYGLVRNLALIGDRDDIRAAIETSKARLSLVNDPNKKKSMAEEFRKFLVDHSDFIIMKGSIDTAAILHVALSIYKSEASDVDPLKQPGRKLATYTGLLVFPDKRFFALSDAAVNPAFTSARMLLTAIENQLDIVRSVVSPDLPLKLAIITAVEKETSAIPATLVAGEAEALSKDLEQKYGPLIVEGPLSFDLATAPDVAEEKHYQGKIVGDANCLVATEINTANVLYKMLSKTMGSLGIMVEIGGIITAGPGTTPIVLTSRGDTAQTKFNSILLALAYSSSIRDKLAKEQ